MSRGLFFIGSLPYKNPQEGLAFVKRYSPHLPFLPQLPEANPQEDMIGQVLRGFEIGYWDAKASMCMEVFLQEFSASTRLKIQIAGPLAVSRSLSIPSHEVILQWLALWKGITRQFENAGVTGELWLQVDEPYWSRERDLPEGYDRFLGAARAIRKNTRVGIHSCATQRPIVAPLVWKLCDFFSFDFTDIPMTEEEKKLWSGAIDRKQPILVAGVYSKNKRPLLDNILSVKATDPIFLSSSCGLYDWSESEIEATFSGVPDFAS